jgi:3-deoxy-manno-octulosonate cytidylyltransferase (CMP-KDO synthetase)
MQDFIIIIPARLKSQRLRNKLLIKIKGKEVLKRVWSRCALAAKKKKIYVASGDKKILDFCKKEGIQTIITTNNCSSGTDRIYECAKKIKAKFYINVQGDEIFVRPDSIKKVINYCKINSKFIINAYTKINKERDFRSSSVPKVLLDNQNNLLFITRASSPTNKKLQFIKAFKQVCIYAYPRKLLLKLKKNKRLNIEKIEDIEILRFLEMGMKVKMIYVMGSELSIDTRKDLLLANNLIKS